MSIRRERRLKSFKMVADVRFEAYDLDNAFELLAAHFTAMRRGIDAESPLEQIGTIDVGPIPAPSEVQS